MDWTDEAVRRIELVLDDSFAEIPRGGITAAMIFAALTPADLATALRPVLTGEACVEAGARAALALETSNTWHDATRLMYYKFGTEDELLAAARSTLNAALDAVGIEAAYRVATQEGERG